MKHTEYKSYEEAIQFVRTKRPSVWPNFGFKTQLMAFEEGRTRRQPHETDFSTGCDMSHSAIQKAISDYNDKPPVERWKKGIVFVSKKSIKY